MGAVEKIEISVSAELLAKARAAVDRGEFASIDEVIRDALSMWSHDFDYGAPEHLSVPAGTHDEQIAWLRARIEEGLASGDPRPLDIEDIKRRGRERLTAIKAAQ